MAIAGPLMIELITEEASVLREQLAVAIDRAQRYRGVLLRIAARADDYSGPCIRAHVADALGMSVKDLEDHLAEEG
ncbi:MAG: hypothetical protein IT429_17080 [Gemmataceae bacterium]|nr:hypothetical protein [Gemmataceae bacterium]